MASGYTKIQGRMKEEIIKLRAAIDESVRENMCEGILLSGGLDTSILSVVASKLNPDLRAYTVAFGKAPDLEYSIKLARQLNLKHHILKLEERNLIANIKPTIEILQSFDPMEVRNSVVIYSGLGFAKKHVSSIMTGDGGDELFAGYSFLQKMSREELREYSRRLYDIMHFPSIDLGRSLGIQVKTPFLCEEVKSLAVKLDRKLKIRDGFGKWILRKAYEDELPPEFVWRDKMPIEHGSGSTALTGILEAGISDDRFTQKKREYEKAGVIIRDKEHLYYYEIYRDIVGEIPSPGDGEVMCSGCGGGMAPNTSYCRICGAINNEMR